MPCTQILPVASVADLLLTVSKLWRLQRLLARKLWLKHGLDKHRQGCAFGADLATALSIPTHAEVTTCGMCSLETWSGKRCHKSNVCVDD